ncbi:MAG: hypothetical protein ACRD7F_04695 [Nitrososphaeraceae archaeon]
MSINDQVKEEVQRQIDIAIEEIPYEKKRWSKSTAKLRLQYKNISDFLLGFEYGRILEDGIWYYRSLINKRRSGAAGEEAKRVTKEIDSIILDRLPEIRRAILKTD